MSLPHSLEQAVLPEWAEHALNGSSYRNASPWNRGQGVAEGDFLAGEVVERKTTTGGRYSDCERLSIKIESGTRRGEPIEPGTWIAVFCSSAILRRWIERDDPREGDKVAIRYLGTDYAGGNARQSIYHAGCVKTEVDEDADW